MRKRLFTGLIAIATIAIGITFNSCEKELMRETVNIPTEDEDVILQNSPIDYGEYAYIHDFLKSGGDIRDIEEPIRDATALKSTDDWIGSLGYDQLDYQGSSTMPHPLYYNLNVLTPFWVAMSWQDLDPQFGTNYKGFTSSSSSYFGTGSLKADRDWWWHQNALLRFTPDLDPTGYNGKIGFLVKGGYAGQEIRFRVAIATDGEGDSEILPNSSQKDQSAWHFWQEETVINNEVVATDQPGVYLSVEFASFDLSGDWEYIEMDAESMWWSAKNTAPAGEIDYIEPLVDDAFLVVQCIDFGQTLFEFVVNGQVSTMCPIKSGSINGAYSVDINDTENYSVSFDQDMEYHQYEWSCTGGTVQSGQGTDQASIKFTSSGSVLVKCRVKWNEFAWSDYVTYTVNVDAGTPSPPTITGASSTSVTSTQAYSMPSGKEGYEWIIPYGAYQVYKYNNTLVLGFNTTGNKTLQGRYKEDGVWSYYGYKSIYVY